MDRYPGYESMLARVEHMKSQVKGQLAPEQFHLVDDLVVFVLDQVNECCNVATVDATTNTTEELLLSGSNGPVARAEDTRSEVNELTNPASPQVNHHIEGTSGSSSNEQSVSPPSVTQSTIPANIEVKVEDESNGQSVQLCEWIKKEEDEDDYEEQVFHCCDCGGEGCEECKVKREIKEEFDESGFETEFGGNSAQAVHCPYTTVKKEEDSEGEDERPNKMRRMDREVENGPVGSVSAFSSVHSSKVTSINVEYIDDQMATSSTNPFSIEDHTQPSQPVTVPFPTPIVSQSSSSTQHVNELLRDELLNAEPMMMDNVALVIDVGAVEFDRGQVAEDNSTLNRVQTEQDDDESDETIEQLQDTNAGDGQQVPAENFLKRIEPADELGNRFECDYRGCGKRMKHRSNMIRHIRSHTGEKLFMCSVEGCDRAFIQKTQLKDHLNSHTGTRPFVCSWPSCEARFGNKSNLTAHIRTHTGKRPFQCDQCDAAFTRHGDLVTHLRTHTGARPFVCTWPECGQAFSQSNHLKAHSLVHSNKRQFVCDVPGCSKTYKRIDHLREHQKAKHN